MKPHEREIRTHYSFIYVLRMTFGTIRHITNRCGGVLAFINYDLFLYATRDNKIDSQIAGKNDEATTTLTLYT